MLPDVPSYMLYRLTWNPERNKFDKRPCRLDGSSLSQGETPPLARRADIQVPDGCMLGLWLTEELGLFFIDLDDCVIDGQLTPDASELARPFITAGCFFEASSSGRGAHIIGSHTGGLPQHSNRRPSDHQYEFYTRDRGVVLNPQGGQGNASVDATLLLHAMLPQHFPPRTAGTLSPVGERRPEWRGPEDDDELIRRALAARGSPAAVFGHRASFADLWNGVVESNSESDMALASHLAFWTGCDVERIERLMRRSGLKRAKWDDHRTYLRDITITHACATTANVYQERERQDVLSVVAGSGDYYKLTDDTIATINNTGTFRELMEQVVPTLPGLAFPNAHAQRVVQALSKRFELFDAKLPIATVRSLVNPPATGELAGSAPPDWFAPFCYVKQSECFYNTVSGGTYSAESFRMEFSRYMPIKQNGTRECPVAYARDRWNIVTVDGMEYRPDCDTYFKYGSREYANEFLPGSLPPVTPPSPECLVAIQAFQQHLYLMCGNRDWLYFQLLYWIAHNVKHPGRKIRWSPILKGVPGDGKSIIADLMRAALGIDNVKMTSISNLSNSGGFTDWAAGAAVNFIEEIQLVGKERYRLFNSMKTFIADTVIDINRKGRASGSSIVNVTNHWANTNYSDALPVDDKDRRWCVVFSPYTDIEGAVRAKGLSSVEDLVRHFKMIGDSMRAEPGAWRGWLLGIDLSSFEPDGRAPITGEKESMAMMSQDVLDQIVMDVLERGGHGITKEVFSSGCLSGMVAIENGGERPKTSTWNHLLGRLGYVQLSGPVWWSGRTHRFWAKNTMTADEAREILDGRRL